MGEAVICTSPVRLPWSAQGKFISLHFCTYTNMLRTQLYHLQQ